MTKKIRVYNILERITRQCKDLAQVAKLVGLDIVGVCNVMRRTDTHLINSEWVVLRDGEEEHLPEKAYPCTSEGVVPKTCTIYHECMRYGVEFDSIVNALEHMRVMDASMEKVSIDKVYSHITRANVDYAIPGTHWQIRLGSIEDAEFLTLLQSLQLKPVSINDVFYFVPVGESVGKMVTLDHLIKNKVIGRQCLVDGLKNSIKGIIAKECIGTFAYGALNAKPLDMVNIYRREHGSWVAISENIRIEKWTRKDLAEALGLKALRLDRRGVYNSKHKEVFKIINVKGEVNT